LKDQSGIQGNKVAGKGGKACITKFKRMNKFDKKKKTQGGPQEKGSPWFLRGVYNHGQ